MVIYQVTRTDWMNESEEDTLYPTINLAYKAAACIIIYELLPDFLYEFIKKQDRVGFIGQLLVSAKKLDFKNVFEQWQYLQGKYKRQGIDKLRIEPLLVETEENKISFNDHEDLEYIEHWFKK